MRDLLWGVIAPTMTETAMKATRKIFVNGTVVSGGVRLRTDVLVEGERIAALGDRASFGALEGDEVIDCTGRLILPGVIDAHCHIQLDTGIFHTQDDWWQGSQEAARGGITTVIDFVGPNPGEDLRHALDFRLDQARGSLIDYTFHMTALDANPATLDAIAKCRSWGISSLKLYTTYRPNYYLDDASLVKILAKAAQSDLTVLVHCENDAIVTHESARYGTAKLWRDYPKMRPEVAEVEAAERVLRLAQYTKARVVIAHNSSDRTARAVKRARKDGVRAFNETAPQYLYLSEEDNYGSPEPWRYILQPPLRCDRARSGLVKAVVDGKVDMVITDHCSYTRAQKCDNPTATPGGLPGFTTLLPLVACLPGMTWERVSMVLARNPAQIYGLWPHKGDVAPGFDADLLVLTDETFTIDEAELRNFAGYSPFHGHCGRGILERVFRRGEEIVRNGEVLGREGTGRFVAV